MQPQKTRKRILACDFGLKRVGLAISDESKIIASPLPNMQAGVTPQKTAELLAKHIETLKTEKKFEIEEIVVGLPLKMDGSSSSMTNAVKTFILALEGVVSMPVKALDERLTSVQADRALREAEFNRKKRASLVDSVAAVLLLQSYLSLKGFSL
jgi:putative holliday junction resolvase